MLPTPSGILYGLNGNFNAATGLLLSELDLPTKTHRAAMAKIMTCLYALEWDSYRYWPLKGNIPASGTS